MMIEIATIALLAFGAPAPDDNGNGSTKGKHKITAEVVSVDRTAQMVTVRMPGTQSSGAASSTDMNNGSTTDRNSNTSANTNRGTTAGSTSDTTAADTTAAGTTAAGTTHSGMTHSGTTTGSAGTSGSAGTMQSSNSTGAAADTTATPGRFYPATDAGTYTLIVRDRDRIDNLSPGDRVEITCRGNDQRSGQSAGTNTSMSNDTSSDTDTAGSSPFVSCGEVSKLKRIGARVASGS